ncbi:hypothetical protein K439DRAFT_1622590 [Ramaria rubella]|nr:hypothetical protein K439DRAFT_1622590 [Ramaria rubella]
MSTLGDLFLRYADNPTISQLAFDTITTFINLLQHLKERIDFTKHSKFSTPPQYLPADIHQFLKQALDLDNITTQACWSSLKDLAWNQDHNIPTKPDLAALLPLLFTHGGPLHIVPIEVFSPTCKCLITTCPNYTMAGGQTWLNPPPSYHFYASLQPAPYVYNINLLPRRGTGFDLRYEAFTLM